MFIGQYEHTLEAKGRLSVPKKYRAQLDTGAVLAQGLDGCLFLFPEASWNQLIHKLSQQPLTRNDARSFTRALSYGAVEVAIDSLGRILIPDYLRAFAGIKTNCVIAGAVDRIEIWDKERFDKYSADVKSKYELIAEKLELT